MFKPSDKVVCVDDRFLQIDATLFSSLPRRDEIYVIRAVRRETGGLLLVGIHGVWCEERGCEYGFKARRFRRLLPVPDAAAENTELVAVHGAEGEFDLLDDGSRGMVKPGNGLCR